MLPVRGLVPLRVPVAIMAVLVLKEPDMGTAKKPVAFYCACALLCRRGAGRSSRRGGVYSVRLPRSPCSQAHIGARASLRSSTPGRIRSIPASTSSNRFSWRWAAVVSSAWAWARRGQNFLSARAIHRLHFLGARRGAGFNRHPGRHWAFCYFGDRAIRIALGAPDRFGFFLAIGCAAMITIQAFVNIGVVVRGPYGSSATIHFLRRQLAGRQSLSPPSLSSPTSAGIVDSQAARDSRLRRGRHRRSSLSGDRNCAKRCVAAARRSPLSGRRYCMESTIVPKAGYDLH